MGGKSMVKERKKEKAVVICWFEKNHLLFSENPDCLSVGLEIWVCSITETYYVTAVRKMQDSFLFF